LPPASLLDLLSPEERRRAMRFVRESDRRRFQLCHVALRSILGDWLGTEPARLRFATGSWGKPALDRPFSEAGLEFNLSHTADLALVAVTRGRRVGIDVEAIRPLRDLLGIARRVLSPSDFERLARLAPGRQVAAFWLAWTSNEACLKAVGSGLASGEPAIRLDAANSPVPCDAQMRLVRVQLDRPFVGALAVEDGEQATFVTRDFPLPACA